MSKHKMWYAVTNHLIEQFHLPISDDGSKACLLALSALSLWTLTLHPITGNLITSDIVPSLACCLSWWIKFVYCGKILPSQPTGTSSIDVELEDFPFMFPGPAKTTELSVMSSRSFIGFKVKALWGERWIEKKEGLIYYSLLT